MDIPEKYKQLWSDWDIRVLLLFSLFIQINLIFLGRSRKTSSSIWTRMFVWSSYLLANWVADFVLGQLSNAMGDSFSSSSNAIIAFWAPFLILHLGGPDTITAYSMEDNELWARHLLSLGYELIIAFYVLFRSLPNTRLLAPTLMIFLVAIIKYVERTYSLHNASAESFRSSIGSSTRQISTNISSTISEMEDLNALNGAFELYSACKHFFVDVLLRVDMYKKTRNLMKEMSAEEILNVTGMELSYAYDELYTKAVINHSRWGYVRRLLCSICIVLAFSFYILTPKNNFDKFDVAITYVLLTTSIFLDFMSTIMLLFSNWMVVSLLNVKKLGNWNMFLVERITRIKRVLLKRRYWSGEMPQLNLISNCLENSTPNKSSQRKLMNWIEKRLNLVQETKLFPSWNSGLETYTLRTLEPVHATQEFQEIIAIYAQRCLNVLQDNFNKPAGLSALQQVTTTPTWAIPAFVKLIKGQLLEHQVLIWHIATELCFYWKSESLHPLDPHQAEDNVLRGVKRKTSEMEACKYLSNYMMHMVLMRPEIMSTMGGVSQLVFWHAYHDMVQFFRRSGNDHHSLMQNAKVDEVCREMLTTAIEWARNPSLFEIARVLAHLMLVIKEDERWQVVTMTWVELLMQGVKNTRANIHVKQLSRGGELLTFIWLLTKHVGMTVELDIGAYMTSGTHAAARQILLDIKHDLQGQD